MFWFLEGELLFVPYSGFHLQLVRPAFIPTCCTVCPKHLQAQHKVVTERKKLKKKRSLQLTSHVDFNVLGSG
jgi:hypothetical protein